MRSLTISSISTTEPLTLSDAKEHLKIQTTAEDRLIKGYIKASRIQLENKIKRALIPTSYNMKLDSFQDIITMPYPPLSSTIANVVITYINATGTTSICASTCYTVDYESEPGKIYLAYNAAWPTDIRLIESAVKIAFRTGYTTATMPENAKLWMKYRVGMMYEHREPIIEGRTISYIKRDFIDGLVDNLLVFSTVT